MKLWTKKMAWLNQTKLQLRKWLNINHPFGVIRQLLLTLEQHMEAQQKAKRIKMIKASSW
jgi:hypothetical protein